MDVIETSPSPAPRPNPWGALISIFLILAIVVAGAYFALSSRVGAPASDAPSGY